MKPETIEQAEQQFNEKMIADYRNLLNGTPANVTLEHLRDRIDKFLRHNCIGTLATCADNIPRSTPVRYRSRDLSVFIMTEGGGKLYNLLDNPLVSFSVYGAYSGFKTVRGLQMWGTAAVISPGDAESYLQAYKTMQLEERADLKEIINLDQVRSDMYMIVIRPNRIRFLSFPQGIMNAELLCA
jgi:uncharacterized pyridoxamine 5'-phosphate oxidase family protein